MNDGRSTFESKLERIDAIVKELEAGDTKLDRAVALFKEGKELARECEALLKTAQAQVEDAMSESAGGQRAKADDVDDQIPF